jgi:hypothetical protein
MLFRPGIHQVNSSEKIGAISANERQNDRFGHFFSPDEKSEGADGQNSDAQEPPAPLARAS